VLRCEGRGTDHPEKCPRVWVALISQPWPLPKRRLESVAGYSAAISRVARIGSFNTLHNADRLASRGRALYVARRICWTD
jgi:hypothetical protein